MGNTSSDNAAAGFQMHHSPRLWTDRGGETEGITNLDGDLSDSGPCWREEKKKKIGRGILKFYPCPDGKMPPTPESMLSGFELCPFPHTCQWFGLTARTLQQPPFFLALPRMKSPLVIACRRKQHAFLRRL